VRQRVEWTAKESLPLRADVLHLQGLDGDAEVPARIRALLDSAMRRYLELAEPRAVIADISIADFAPVYRGDGHNAHETPLERIYPQAHGLALMAATVGPRASAEVSELFDQHAHEPPDDGEAVLLGLGLHLEQHRVVVPVEEPAHVGLDLGIHDVHRAMLTRYP